MRRLMGVTVAVLLLAAACGSGDVGTGEVVDEGAFRRQIAVISSETDADLERVFGDVDQAFEATSSEVALSTLATAIPDAIDSIEDAAVELERLDVPEQYEDDVARHVERLDAIVAVERERLEAAEARDVTRARQLLQQINSFQRSYLSEVSAEYRSSPSPREWQPRPVR